MSSVGGPDEAESEPDVAIDVTGPTEGLVTVRVRGELHARHFAAALMSATSSGAATILLDLSTVTFCTLEDVALLLPHIGCAEYRLVLRPSPAVQRKLNSLGLDKVLVIAPDS